MRRTRVLAVSAVDWQSGFRADLAALGEFCRARGMLFVGRRRSRRSGALRTDVEACGVDVLAAGGHKWLLAPEGCGMLFVSDRVVERLHPVGARVEERRQRRRVPSLPLRSAFGRGALRARQRAASRASTPSARRSICCSRSDRRRSRRACSRPPTSLADGLRRTRRDDSQPAQRRRAIGHPDVSLGRDRRAAPRVDCGASVLARPAAGRNPSGAALL